MRGEGAITSKNRHEGITAGKISLSVSSIPPLSHEKTVNPIAKKLAEGRGPRSILRMPPQESAGRFAPSRFNKPRSKP